VATNVLGCPTRILIAEDDRLTRESLRRTLELQGFGVTTVGDGAKALELARTECFDLVVLDRVLLRSKASMCAGGFACLIPPSAS